MPAHVDKLDSTLSNQAPNESGSGIQQLPRLVHREKAIHPVFTSSESIEPQTTTGGTPRAYLWKTVYVRHP